MSSHNFRNNHWRFYFFQQSEKKYCFDSFTHKIFELSDELFALLQNRMYKEIQSKYKVFYKSIIKCKPCQKSVKQSKECLITIDFSNKCNLNCKYCYREKKETASLSFKELHEIFEYVTQIYDPSASAYNFSLCYTSESSFDLEKLKYIDILLGQYEGYLFSEKQISRNKADLLFSKLPLDIQNKYQSDTDGIHRLNQILINEKLWNKFDYSNNDYLVKVLSKTNELSYSKSIMANRQILNKTFSEIDIENKISYFSMSFMTNATNINQEYIDFLKSILVDSIYVSLDGPEYIHNENRRYSNGKDTYNDVITGIKKLQINGITVIPSAVIIPQNPDLNIIVNHFISLGFNEMSFNLARGKIAVNIFSYESINILINSIKVLFEEFFESTKSDSVNPKIKLLKNTIIFSYLRMIYFRTYITNRCDWGNNLVIDSKGNLYHCNSTIGYEKDYLGNYRNNKTRNKLLTIPNVNNNKKCRKCYAKSLCGGTCYAEIIMGNTINEEMECYYHKMLINESFKFYTKLKTSNLLDIFMKKLN